MPWTIGVDPDHEAVSAMAVEAEVGVGDLLLGDVARATLRAIRDLRAGSRSGRRRASAWLTSCSTTQHRRALLLDHRDRLVHLLDDDRRQAERHLVEEQQLGVRHQRAGDGERLLLASRQAALLRLQQALEQREGGEHSLGAPRALALRHGRRPRGSPRRSATGRCADPRAPVRCRLRRVVVPAAPRATCRRR